MSRVACAVLALLAFVAIAVVQANLPWAEHEQSAFGGTEKGTVRTWSAESEVAFTAFGAESSDSETSGWYDGGWEDEDMILCFTGRGPAGAILTVVGGVMAAAAVLLYYLASQDFFDNDSTWMAGFYVALVGAVFGVAGGVIGLAGGNLRDVPN
jgi:hypothetical protein